MRTEVQRERKLPRRLPTVSFEGVEYFVDERLREFRAVCDVGLVVKFESEAGSAMLEAFHTVDCPHCQQELCVFWRTRKESIACTRCGKQVPLNRQ